jgi:hypothetical protein
MDWSRGHNDTVHNRIGGIGFYTGGTQARFRDEDLADAYAAEACAASNPPVVDRNWQRGSRDMVTSRIRLIERNRKNSGNVSFQEAAVRKSSRSILRWENDSVGQAKD